MPKRGRMITKDNNNKAKCFICDEENLSKGVPLLISQTPYSKTEIPTKIGQLIGEKFMVIVSYDDMLCNKCSLLVNQLDKLETDAAVIKQILYNNLKTKYKLSDQDYYSPLENEEKDYEVIKLFNIFKKHNIRIYYFYRFYHKMKKMLTSIWTKIIFFYLKKKSKLIVKKQRILVIFAILNHKIRSSIIIIFKNVFIGRVIYAI